MTTDDQTHAAELDSARSTLNQAGAARLERRPWEHPGQPRSDTDLVRFAAWAGRDAQGTDPAVVAAGLRLLSSARVELDQIEAGLLFAARSSGLTWPQIAEALGLGTAQAAQQRLNRVFARAGDRDAEA
ncbi:hypothetical protein [Rhodococcus koreensis]|uniref:DNA-binding protein n=1 Tax=Rhodococcus koreensis TaxID=99653 RepID=A0A1H4Q727_9NOCA|nr:hypothetical protein [Rhodococcus koreensis]SEC15421.1 hypothetical protein SAMN04490239_3075 [Rhodococcus koreensis]